MTNLLSILLVDAANPGQTGYLNILFILGIVVVFYFFMIRPQMKRSKDQKKFRTPLLRSKLKTTFAYGWRNQQLPWIIRKPSKRNNLVNSVHR